MVGEDEERCRLFTGAASLEILAPPGRHHNDIPACASAPVDLSTIAVRICIRLLLVGALAFVALACDEGTAAVDGAIPDSAVTDTGLAPDATAGDSGADGRTDAATDAARDTAADAASDAARDAGRDATVAPTPQRIMCIGDSITEARFQHYAYRYHLWQLIVADGIDHVDFVGSKAGTYSGGAPTGGWDSDHDGHWGAKADEILGGGIPYGGVGSIRDWAPVHRPTVALIQLGTNDCRGGQSGASTLAEIASIIGVLRESVPNVTVLVAQVIQSRQAPLNTCLASLNAAMPDWAAARSTATSPVVIVDQWSALDPSTDLEDDYHTNESGGSKMAARWYATLRDYL